MTAIIIPAYNPDSILNELVEKTKKYVKKLYVIDDGSETPIELSNNNVDVLRNNNNRGKGYSLIKGFQFALENNIKQVITLDWDGQHDPGYIPEFLKCDKSIDIAVGKRDFTKNNNNNSNNGNHVFDNNLPGMSFGENNNNLPGMINTENNNLPGMIGHVSSDHQVVDTP